MEALRFDAHRQGITQIYLSLVFIRKRNEPLTSRQMLKGLEGRDGLAVDTQSTRIDPLRLLAGCRKRRLNRPPRNDL